MIKFINSITEKQFETNFFDKQYIVYETSFLQGLFNGWVFPSIMHGSCFQFPVPTNLLIWPEVLIPCQRNKKYEKSDPISPLLSSKKFCFQTLLVHYFLLKKFVFTENTKYLFHVLITFTYFTFLQHWYQNGDIGVLENRTYKSQKYFPWDCNACFGSFSSCRSKSR